MTRTQTMATGGEPTTPPAVFSPVVSLVHSVTDKATHSATLLAVLRNIQNGRWRDQVEAVRAAKGKEERERLKRALPGVLFSGEFKHRKADGLLNYSAVLCADWDAKDNDAHLLDRREQLAQDPYVLAYFLSPSGAGLKVLFKCPPAAALHAASFAAVERYCLEKYQIKIDGACKDLPRLCFVSYDPDLGMNLAAKEFSLSPPAGPPIPPNDSKAGAADETANPVEGYPLPTKAQGQTSPADLRPPVGIKDGHRDAEGYKYAKRLQRAGLPEAEAEARILEYADQCAPSFPRNEALKCLRSAYSTEAERNPKLSVEEANTLQRLAAMSQIEYDRCRKAEAKKMNVQVSTLDAERARLRATAGGTPGGGQGRAVSVSDVEPWPDPPDGEALLLDVADLVSRYVFLPEHGAIVVALWAAHTHCFESFVHSPRLNLYSPERGCGKTTLLDVLETLVARPIRADNITPAVLFRLVERDKPTLLLDETDVFIHQSDDLRGLLNAGHRRGGKAYRCEGENNDLREFAVFSPVALAGIGRLPSTLHDRSIQLRLNRAAPGEIGERFDSRHTEPLNELARKMARWAKDHAAVLAKADPALPENIHNRMADNWRPLAAIALSAGGCLPGLIYKAIESHASAAQEDAHGARIELLADIQTIFRDRFPAAAPDSSRITSQDLAGTLAQMEGTRWPEYGRAGGPITPNQVARLLRAFDIRPRTLRLPGDPPAKGYFWVDFVDAFARFLPSQPGETPPPNRYTVTTIENKGDSSLFEPLHGKTVLRIENATLANKNGICNDVTDQKGGGPQPEGKTPATWADGSPVLEPPEDLPPDDVEPVPLPLFAGGAEEKRVIV